MSAKITPLGSFVARVQALKELEALQEKVGEWTDKAAWSAWNAKVSAAHSAACEALDAMVPGASDAMFYSVSEVHIGASNPKPKKRGAK